jgi:hypothetical protein
MAAASPRRADVTALRRSDRSKPLLLGLLCLGALVAATWSWAGQKGTGEPDEARKVLVVIDGSTPLDHVSMLSRAGFDHPMQGTVEEIESRAAKLELEERGLEGIISVADELGYGFVALQNPQRFDLSDLDLQDDAPTVEETTSWAVLSVGDLAFPHWLSVDPKASEVVEMPGIDLLQAMYRQQRLAEDRETLTHHPTIEELGLQANIDSGLNVVNRVARLESLASNLAIDIEKLAGLGGASPLGLPLETGGPVPLPDGGILSVVQDVRIVSRDAFTLSYDLADTLRLEYTPAGSFFEGPDRRVRCTTLAGGELAVDEFPEIVTSPDGSVFLIHTASKGLEVWAALDGGQCRFERQGRIPSPEKGERGLGVPSKAGQIARVSRDGDGASFVRLYQPTMDPRFEPATDLAELERVKLGKPVWLGERFMVAGGRTWEEGSDSSRDGLFLFSLDHPGAALEIDTTLFGEVSRFRDMISLEDGQGSFLLTTRDAPTKVFRVSFAEPMTELFPAEVEKPEDPVDAEAPVDAKVPMLTPEQVTVELIHEGGVLSAPSISPEGAWVAFSHRDEERLRGAEDVALLRLDPPATELLMVTEGTVGDHKPRFTDDGKHLAFETRIEVSISGHQLGSPRVAPIKQ